MTLNGWIQIAVFLAIIIALTRPLGGYLTRVASGERHAMTPVLGWLERGFYKAAGVDPAKEQSWLGYAFAMLVFKAAGFLLLYAVLRMQTLLPLNPAGQGAITPDLAFNTAVSFLTNTNWQSYGGETTMSFFSQMFGLTVQNFLSAAAGIAVAFAVIRGFARKSTATLGNFWADLTRITLYVLLPLSVIGALVCVWQGIPQTFTGTVEATTLEGAKQIIALGPVASQEVIKILGTNGGGFFNVNSAHPFENPTVLINMLQCIAILVLGGALTNTFGRMVRDERQGWAIFAAMALLFVVGVGVLYWSESHANPAIAAMGVDPSLGNMEGKETRFGIAQTAIFATVTTDTSCGAVDSMHESFLPLGGAVPLVNMMLGEVIFGGVGSGIYGFLLFAIIAVFVAGLMVGRTPEYVGKKIEAREVKLTMLAILVMPLFMLGLTALAVVLPGPLSALSAAGPHGFTEALYAYVEAGANNGSAFAGISANTPFWNTTLAIDMLVGRFFVMVPALAIAGSLAAKKTLAPSAGTFPTHGALFVGLAAGVIIIVGGLTFFPAVALGPIVEHFAMNAGTLY